MGRPPREEGRGAEERELPRSKLALRPRTSLIFLARVFHCGSSSWREMTKAMDSCRCERTSRSSDGRANHERSSFSPGLELVLLKSDQSEKASRLLPPCTEGWWRSTKMLRRYLG